MFTKKTLDDVDTLNSTSQYIFTLASETFHGKIATVIVSTIMLGKFVVAYEAASQAM
jgi:hypothetical protein